MNNPRPMDRGASVYRHPDCVSYGKYAYVPENGYLTVPDLPGLGQELSDKAMAESLGHIEVR